MRTRPGLTAKLFLALLAMSVLVALAMGTAARISFTRGFLGYLNEIGIQRVDGLVPRLADEYREHGGWRHLRGSRREWFRLLRPEDGRGAPPDNADLLPELTGANFRVGLIDADGEHVAGFPDFGPDAIRRPVEVDGRVVGWVGLVPFQSLTETADLRFVRQQQIASWVIGLGTLLLAAGVASVLARWLMRPVRGIAASTRQLANGDYATRVPVHSGDEIGRLGDDFNRLAVTLERNEQMRRAFIADVSHELRTPLAVLRGELEAIEDGVRPLTPAAITSLQGEVATLSKLVSDLYDLSMADVGALTYRMVDVDLVELLETAVAAFRGRLAERGIGLTLAAPDAPLVISGDEARLRQLLGNLLENCARYVDADGQVRVIARLDGDRVLLRVEDSGPGVPQDVRARLFERFYRGEASRNRASGGAGLGLAICRSIVEAHGGRIVAEQAPLGGLAVVMHFPRA